MSERSPAPEVAPGNPGTTLRAPDDDAAHVTRFEACAIPLTEWNHRAHLRVAYHYLRHHPFEEALARMRRGIQAYNAAQHVEDRLDHGYHETLTQMWMRILHGLRAIQDTEAGFEAFVERHPYVLVRLLGRLFYTRERIMSDHAKRTYVTPDLATFPGER